MNAGFKLPTGFEAEPAEQKFDLRMYVNFIWRHWMFIAAVVGVSLIVGIIWVIRATPLYTASTQVMLERDKAPGDNASADYSYYATTAAVAYQLAILESDSLLRRVVIKEKLASPTPTAENVTDEDAKKKNERAIEAAIGALRGALAARRNGDTQVITISITWTDPVKAAQLANAMADALVVDQLDARFEAAKRASGWLSDRIVDLRQQLRVSEDAVAEFRSLHGLIRTGSNVSLNDQQLADLNGKLLAARADAAEKRTRVDFLAEVAAGKKSLDSLPASFQSTVLGTLRGKLAEASQRQADLLARYNSRHPAVVTVDAEKRDIERSIATETQRMIETVKSEYTLAKAHESATEQAMREATGQGGLNSEDGIRLRELERTAAVNKSLFEDFLQKAKVTAEQSTFRPREARVIMPAQGAWQSYPNRQRMLMMALIIGVGLGVGGALGRELLNVGFTSARQIEELLQLPVLSSVEKMDEPKLQKDGTKFPVPYYQIHYPLSAFSESMRTLRSGILMTDVDTPPKVIHITSSSPSEGKSTIAVSLAISAASSGKKVVIVDADLRHPSTSRFFKTEQKQGLVDLLTGAVSLQEVLKFKSEKLALIPAGSKSLNPPDLLGSERMRALVEDLKANFDCVVIDTPPVGPVIDSVIVAGLADKTIFVIRWASTSRELVQASLQKLSVQKRVGGIVLNLVVPHRAKKYGSDHYGGAEYAKYYSDVTA